MNVLVTGGAGFIGCNFIRFMIDKYDDLDIVNVDLLTYAGNLENLSDLADHPRYHFVKADIALRDDVTNVFKAYVPDTVVNFAAETHVDRSLMDAGPFIRTNILGVQALLDACREHGVRRFLQVSTDEVYGSLGPQGTFTEQSPIQPNNPYAATKAAADFMARAAHKTHGLDAVITRCSNNFGPHQFPEKLMPLMIANALENKDLPVYGDGLHVRDWIFVLDHSSAIDAVLRKAEPGSVTNIGSDHAVPNIEIVKTILSILDKPETLIKHVEDRPGHDRRYAMDSSKLRNELGWRPEHSFEEAMEATVHWYLSHREWLERVRTGDYLEYYEKMYGQRNKVGSE